jgi:hypothetical protein
MTDREGAEHGCGRRPVSQDCVRAAGRGGERAHGQSGLSRGRADLCDAERAGARARRAEADAEQQAEFVAELPEVFEPVQGGWGRMGMTYLVLDRADEATMRGALTVAHRNVAAKQSAGRAAEGKAAKKRAR